MRSLSYVLFPLVLAGGSRAAKVQLVTEEVNDGDGDPTADIKTTHNMCATLELDFDITKDTCEGSPRRTVRVPCGSEPGSPCINFRGISAKDTYCTPGGFHQTAYPHAAKCKGQPEENFFPKDTCFKGAKFVSCNPGPCNSGEEVLVLPDEWMGTQSVNGIVDN